MTDADRDPRAPGGDDLFDLPNEAQPAKDGRDWKGAAPDVDQPSSALPRRPEPTRPAGPPLTTVESSVAGILSEVRKRNATADAEASAEAEAAGAAPRARFRPTRRMWLAFAGLALANAAVLITWSLRARTTPADAPHDVEHATATVAQSAQIEHVVDPAPAPAQPAVSHDAAPVVRSGAPAVDSGAALEIARQSLLAAREEIAAGRRGAARARLGRIGLAIDALPAADREPLRAEVALVVAQSIQADADQAARSQP